MILAQSGVARPPGEKSLVPYMGAVGAIIALIVVASIALLWYRRRVLRQEDESARASGILDELRALRDRGELSPEEYDAARKSIAARAAGRPAPVSPASRKAAPPGALRAKPGHDLTGAPLPRPPTAPPPAPDV